jgi:hypothetical protein
VRIFPSIGQLGTAGLCIDLGPSPFFMLPYQICSALWISCPLDGDFIFGLGWIDDGFAFALGLHHLIQLFSPTTPVTNSDSEQVPSSSYVADGEVIDAEAVTIKQDGRAA